MPQSDLARELAYGLDPVLWARERLDIGLDDWQEDVLRCRGVPQLILASRQIGKSHTVAVRALHEMLYGAAPMVLVASPSEDQSKELFRKLTSFYDLLENAPPAVRRNTVELELGSGARCCAVPGSERTIRSKSAVSLLIVDEAARIDDNLVGAVTPMLATTDGDLLALTSAFGRRGWFYEQWTEGGADYHRICRTALDCPRISAAFLEKEKKRLGPLLFRQEYLCEFIDPGSSAFSSELIDACFADFDPFP